jgi:gamma-glutamylcyclotransferase (GGCT)/AIG2-like uncharacterized protein YtfP
VNTRKRHLFAGLLVTALLSLLLAFTLTGHTAKAETEHAVFAYGTLTSPIITRLITGRWIESKAAILPGYQKEGLDVRPVPKSHTQGVLFRVTDQELARLDRYERVGVRYNRYLLTLKNGTKAWVYRRIHPKGETDE